jgi:hypothetical protein
VQECLGAVQRQHAAAQEGLLDYLPSAVEPLDAPDRLQVEQTLAYHLLEVRRKPEEGALAADQRDDAAGCEGRVEGYIGSPGATTAHMQGLIKEAIRGGRVAVAAINRRLIGTWPSASKGDSGCRRSARAEKSPTRMRSS